MKRKFLSSLMLGALIVASANLTSCKDYDDEIQDLQTQINALTPAINQVKSDLQAEIANLKSQLEAKDAEIKTIAENAKKAADENAGKLADEIARATAAEAALEAKLGTAQEALDALQKLADGKVDKTDFNDEVTKIYAAIAAVDGKLADHMQKAVEQFGALQKGIDDEKALREAAVKDLQQQLDALQTWKDKIAAIEKDYVTNQALKDAIAALKVDDKIAALKTEINGVIDGLKEDLKKVNERIDKLGIDAVVAELKGLVENEAKLREEGDAAVLEAAKNAQKAAETAQKAAEDAQKAADDAQGSADAAAAAVKAEEDARKAAISAEESARKAKDGELEQAIKDAKDALQKSIESLQNTLTTEVARLDKRIDDVETSLQAVSDKLDKVEAFVNALNVLVKGELRSLVFKPDFYYYGIEATRLLSLDYNYFVADKKTPESPIPAASADKAEKKGTTIDNDKSKEANVDFTAQDVARTIHERYDSLKGFKVLNLVAKYHMNPSNVSKESILNVTVVDDDKPFETDFDTRASQAVISVNKDVTPAYWVENGMLNVNLKVQDQEKIKSVFWNDSVTVFAVKATVRSGEKGDTTITSDYAALKYQQIKDVRLAHAIVNTKTPESITMTGLLNTHCGTCNLLAKYNKQEISMNHSHLFATVDEAKYWIEKTARTSDGKFGEGQDTVDWNSTLDLRQLVEVHYTTVDGAHEKLSGEKLENYGLEYKFELTKLIIGDNKTSESAQAAINPEDGYTFRPQLPAEKTGVQLEYGADQSRTTINRVPLVRVSLIEKSTGRVLDYGYIPVRISETATEQPVAEPTKVEYTSSDKWSYTEYPCFASEPKAYGLTTTWIETQYDLMKHGDLPQEFSREDFEANYLNQDNIPGPLYQETPAEVKAEAQQYLKNAKGVWEPVKNTADLVGTITYLPDLGSYEGTKTSVFKWEIAADQAVEVLKKYKDKTIEVACLLKSKNPAYPDIYVVFKSNPNNIAFKSVTVEGDVALDAHKIGENWFKNNSNSIVGDGGLYEIHAQTLVPEDFFDMTAQPFDATFGDVFVGNFKSATVMPNNWITISAKENGAVLNPTPSEVTKAYAKDKIKTDFVFETAKQTDKVFKGMLKPNEVTEFRLFASDLDVAEVNKFKSTKDKEFITNCKQGKNLYAYVKTPEDAQLIAKIENDELATMQISLVANEDHNGYSEAMLNYKAHNQLAEDVLKAEVSLIAWIELPQTETAEGSICPIPLKNNSFVVRFLRPINVTGTDDKVVVDASYAHGDEPQTILLEDLLSFTDWRDTWKPVYNAKTKKWEGLDYKTFYGIQAVKLQGVEDGERISSNPEVMSTLNQADGGFVSMKTVSDNVDFIYLEQEGKLQYRNFSNVTDEFKVKLPVMVQYYWGTIYQNVIVTIKPSTAQAKKF